MRRIPALLPDERNEEKEEDVAEVGREGGG